MNMLGIYTYDLLPGVGREQKFTFLLLTGCLYWKINKWWKSEFVEVIFLCFLWSFAVLKLFCLGMVRLHVKKGTESQFLYETNLNTEIQKLIEELTYIYNGRLKVSRICYELEELVKHGTFFPPEMLGLTEEQVEELHLVDEWGEKCIPSGGWTLNKDPIGRRNGHQPNEAMQSVINKTMDEAKALISKKQIDNNVCVTLKMVHSALDMLRGAVMIVYPMGLPPHDPIRQEFENAEDLTGTQASLDVLEAVQTSLWFSGKEMMRDKKLSDYLGRNEKVKMIVKLQKSGLGAPQREPVMSEEEQKAMMLHAYRKQEELKKLDENTDDEYLDSPWADSRGLKNSLHGLSDIKWRPK